VGVSKIQKKIDKKSCNPAKLSTQIRTARTIQQSATANGPKSSKRQMAFMEIKIQSLLHPFWIKQIKNQRCKLCSYTLAKMNPFIDVLSFITGKKSP
jgi:hypothetical protein